MTTLKLVIFEKKQKADGTCPVYIQVVHNRKPDWINTGVFVRPEFWRDGKVTNKDNKGDANARLKNIELGKKVTDGEQIILNNKDKLPYLSVKEVIKLIDGKKLQKDTGIMDFVSFTESRLVELKQQGVMGTYNPLRLTCNRVKDYKGNYLPWDTISESWLKSFEHHYLQKGQKQNTVAIYLTYIRYMYNEAINEFKTPELKENYPFGKGKFKIDREPTMNRDLDVETIRQIRDYTSDGLSKRWQVAKDVFMLQVYLLGVNIKDMYNWMPTDVVKGRLQFHRAKTGRQYNIKIEPEAQAIIDKYQGTTHLLWFADTVKASNKPHHRESNHQWKDISSFLKSINWGLQDIQKKAKLDIPKDLTTYFSRHSVATLMSRIGIPDEVITMVLGHQSPERSMKVTGIYINRDFHKVDEANRKFIDFVNSEYTCEDYKLKMAHDAYLEWERRFGKGKGA